MLNAKISFNEMYPFTFDSDLLTVDENIQRTSDEDAKSPSDDIAVVPSKLDGGNITKNYLYILIGVILAILVVTHL